MTEAHSRTDDSIDVRMLVALEDLSHEAFPGGRNDGFRVFFSPEVHSALWQHAAADTSVEICGVLVGSWHRDHVGPFVKIIESIRGEGAETRFAEVTFTHETWAKINAAMDTRFTSLAIVGWYHTHPDFGIFLSDRDRFIQEHFFSGPGQVAHVIDPIKKIEGVFVWRDGKPSLAPHFWIGDRVVVADSGLHSTSDRGQPEAKGNAAGDSVAGAHIEGGRRLHPAARLISYGGVFLLGYLIANILSAWDRERFVESVLASNGPFALLRVGLADGLDRLRGDLAEIGASMERVQSSKEQADESFTKVRAQLAIATDRIAVIKATYGNPPAEDALLKQLFRDKLNQMARGAAEVSTSAGPKQGGLSPAEGKAAQPGEINRPEDSGTRKVPDH
jgi:proteasome lid subunit RPN8/RPN11